MNPQAQHFLDAFVEKYRESVPRTWIRIVTWHAHLADEQGRVDRSAAMRVEAVVLWEKGELEQRYFRADTQAGFDLEEMDRALVGEPEAPRTLLRIEIDRDGPVRADFDTEVRPLENSADDPYFDAAHEYLDRNRETLELFAERLRGQGDLPTGAATALDPATLPPSQRPGTDRSETKGRFGRIFGRG